MQQQEEQEDKRMLSKLVVVLGCVLLLCCWVGQVQGANCEPTQCNNITIQPPFSIEDGCGEPYFKLTCNATVSGQILVLHDFPNISVTGIDYKNYTITLNTTEFIREFPTAGCLMPNPGFNMDNYTAVLQLCELPGGGTSLVHPDLDNVGTIRTPDGCVLKKQNKTTMNGLDCYIYKKAPGQPLDGYLLSYQEFISYEEVTWWNPAVPPWWNPAAPPRTSQGSRNQKAIAPVAGAVGGVAAFAAAAVACFCCLRRKRRRLGPNSSSKMQFLFSYGKKDTTRAYKNGDSFNSGESTRFTLQELEEATNDFSEDGRLGDGGFGTVYKGKLRDERLVAVKKLNPWNAQGKHQFDNEVTILSQVKHPYLVQLYGCCLEGRELLLVYEFVANGTLADHLHGLDTKSRSYPGPFVACFLDWESRLNIVAQTAEALAFLHDIKPPIFHRDVKSTNILVDENWNAKVGDFGLSRLVPSLELTHVTTAPQGTPGYLDPDYHQSYQLTDKSDVYSLGVVLMEIVSALPAVDMSRGRREINLATLAVSRIQEGRLDSIMDKRLGKAEDEVLWSQVRRVAELGFRCLAPEKDDRPTMREVAKTLKEVLEQAAQRSFHKKQGPAAVDSPTSVQVKWPSNTTSPSLSSDSIV